MTWHRYTLGPRVWWRGSDGRVYEPRTMAARARWERLLAKENR